MPGGEIMLCCKTMILTHMRRNIPYGSVTADGIVDVNDDIISEMNIVNEDID